MPEGPAAVAATGEGGSWASALSAVVVLLDGGDTSCVRRRPGRRPCAVHQASVRYSWIPRHRRDGIRHLRDVLRLLQILQGSAFHRLRFSARALACVRDLALLLKMVWWRFSLTPCRSCMITRHAALEGHDPRRAAGFGAACVRVAAQWTVSGSIIVASAPLLRCRAQRQATAKLITDAVPGDRDGFRQWRELRRCACWEVLQVQHCWR